MIAPACASGTLSMGACPTLPPTRILPGAGRLAVCQSDDASCVVFAEAHAPLKLIIPRPRGGSVWACATSFGGGLVAGDRLSLDITVGEGATAVIGTQATTKVYRSEGTVPAQQQLQAKVGAGAVLALLPDAASCFAGARFRTESRIDLHPTGSLILLDWLTAGRAARGERWAFADYRSRIRVVVDGRVRWRESLHLEGGQALPARMGGIHVLANLLLAGPRLRDASIALLEHVAALPAEPRQAMLMAASPLGDGVLLRMAGTTHEEIERTLRLLLAPAWPVIGGDPWSRRG
jgi:urease accessory protein